jgi:hypothetical protein
MELEDGQHAPGSEARRPLLERRRGALFGRPSDSPGACRPSTTSKRAVDVGIILRASTGLSLGLAFNLPRNAGWPGPLQELGR